MKRSEEEIYCRALSICFRCGHLPTWHELRGVISWSLVFDAKKGTI
jgi:hypothetical protein